MDTKFKYICELQDCIIFHDTLVGYAIGHKGLPHLRRVQTGKIRWEGERALDFQSGEVQCIEGAYKIRSFCTDPEEHNKIYPNMCKPSFRGWMGSLVK